VAVRVDRKRRAPSWSAAWRRARRCVQPRNWPPCASRPPPTIWGFRAGSNFSPGASTLGLPTIESHRQGLPDIAAIPRAEGEGDSRLAPHIALGERERVAAPRARWKDRAIERGSGRGLSCHPQPRSYRGRALLADRDRLNRGGDNKSDSQAVFVGTSSTSSPAGADLLQARRLSFYFAHAAKRATSGND
jgi:hypothetical protein